MSDARRKAKQQKRRMAMPQVLERLSEEVLAFGDAETARQFVAGLTEWLADRVRMVEEVEESCDRFAQFQTTPGRADRAEGFRWQRQRKRDAALAKKKLKALRDGPASVGASTAASRSEERSNDRSRLPR